MIGWATSLVPLLSSSVESSLNLTCTDVGQRFMKNVYFSRKVSIPILGKVNYHFQTGPDRRRG
jgi:hypothetical protein